LGAQELQGRVIRPFCLTEIASSSVFVYWQYLPSSTVESAMNSSHHRTDITRFGPHSFSDLPTTWVELNKRYNEVLAQHYAKPIYHDLLDEIRKRMRRLEPTQPVA
jgi:hypothetical protein